MAQLPVLKYPDPRLYKKAAVVTEFGGELEKLTRDMAETMYEAPGVGLAATQVDMHQRVIVIDTSESRDRLLILVNPEIVDRRGEQFCDEGCLSVPGFYEPVERAAWIRTRAQGLDGKPFEFEAEDLLAICVQHEMDHLEGKVFVQYLSRLKQNRIRSKLLKQQREAG